MLSDAKALTSKPKRKAEPFDPAFFGAFVSASGWWSLLGEQRIRGFAQRTKLFHGAGPVKPQNAPKGVMA